MAPLLTSGALAAARLVATTAGQRVPGGMAAPPAHRGSGQQLPEGRGQGAEAAAELQRLLDSAVQGQQQALGGGPPSRRPFTIHMYLRYSQLIYLLRMCRSLGV